MQPSPNSNTCATTCPFGYGENNTLAACVDCAANQQVWYNKLCLDACPDGYVKTVTGSCGKCSNPSLHYYNHTCVTSCPSKTYSAYNSYINQYECKSCYVGCDTCVDGTSSGCLSCSEGFFYFNNACNSGCPSDKYANPKTMKCEQCQPPCVTCSQPNNQSCTSCPSGYFLLDGTCVISCPDKYYQTFYTAEDGIYQIPICSPKLVLTFNLSLTTEARVINMNFNYGIVNMIQAISQKMQVQIANTQLDDVLFVLSPVTVSQIKFQYVGSQYFPSKSLLTITIDLDAEDFNSNWYQQFRIIDKTATIQIKEIYPFSQAEKQMISSTTAATEAGGNAIASIQAGSSVAQGGVSLSLLRTQLVGEVLQLMRFVAIRWPPNIAQYFATSSLDPASMIVPIDLITKLHSPLDDRNYSMPRVFEEYETSPFFTQNFNGEISNLVIWVAALAGGAFLLNFLKKCFNKRMKRNNGKKYLLFPLVQKISQLLNWVDDSTLWNLLLMLVLSIFQSGCLWALLNMRYASVLLEPPTTYTWVSLGLAIFFFILNFALFGVVTRVVIKNLKYLVQTGGKGDHSQQEVEEERLKNYSVLFEDFNRKKRIQLLYVPISMLRSLLFVMILVLLTFYPLIQMILIWSLHTAFILYFILCQPLKVRWLRLMTLLLELLSYGCTTLGFIFGFVDLDATTANEVGLVFLFLTIGSTIAGGLLSLIQALQLVWAIYKYLKNLRAAKRVHPIPLSEPQPLHNCLTPATAEKRFEGKIIGAESSSRSKPPSATHIKDLSEDEKMLAALGKLSPQVFEKSAKDKQLLEELREWWNSNQSALNIDTEDYYLKTEMDKDPKLLDRVKKTCYRNDSQIPRRPKVSSYFSGTLDWMKDSSAL